MAEKSSVGSRGCIDGGCLGGSFGCNWENMSANLVSALLVSVPKVANGVSGVGCRRMWTRSSAAAFAMSFDDVADILTW